LDFWFKNKPSGSPVPKVHAAGEKCEFSFLFQKVPFVPAAVLPEGTFSNRKYQFG
jgi:hypothetical protein